MRDTIRDIIDLPIDLKLENVNKRIDDELSILLGKKMAKKKKHILVMSGGGIKGIAHIGALKALDDLNMLNDITILTGVSAGGIICTLYNIGYTPDELLAFVSLFDINKLDSMELMNIASTFGLNDGKNVSIVLEKLFDEKGIDHNITFLELFKKTKKKLILGTSCINDKKSYYFSYETYPNMSVITAVKMSMAIPIYFHPIRFENKLFVDGGCRDNYPIQLFKDELDSVIGVYLAANQSCVTDIDNIEDFLMNTIQCLFEGVTHNSTKGFEKQTIKLTLNQDSHNPLGSKLSEDKIKELFLTGYNAVIEKFNHS